MSEAQIDELALIAKSDVKLWQQLLQRELEIEKALSDTAKQGLFIDSPSVVLDPPAYPTLESLVSDLIARRYGADHDYIEPAVKMRLRMRLRKELGLPT